MISDRVRERLAHDFPGAAHEQAVALVQRIPDELSFWKIVSHNDEVEAAALQFAGGDLERLSQAVERALRDWRDLLVAVRGG